MASSLQALSNTIKNATTREQSARNVKDLEEEEEESEKEGNVLTSAGNTKGAPTLTATGQAVTTVNWTASIFNNSAWPKSNPQPIDDKEAFTRWITEIKRSCQSRGGVEVRMENPKDEVKKANKEKLVAQTIKQMEARRTGPLNRKSRVSGASNGPLTAFDVDSEEEGSSGPNFTALDNQIDEIYQKYGMNTEYNWIHPVYLNPLDADQYILLTSGNVEIWAKALLHCWGQLGLPPKHYQVSQPPGPSRASPPSSVVGDDDHTLGEYLQFVGIASHKREEVLNTLLQNNIDNYKMFKELTYEQLAALDLNLSIITILCSNVTKYRFHLARHP
ncbi:hypothetical protein H4Q26_005874 [Puccinia striiformis f. sp. tritici PST-130]|nr:hypothetical protein H4Q26_005874 [Puccinia striiformis f. sp. tritici PST-130]